jgi:predicted Zn-dependent peptidase
MVDAWMFGSLAELREFDQRIRAVTAEEMRRVAAEYFHEGRRVEGIIRGVGRTV